MTSDGMSSIVPIDAWIDQRHSDATRIRIDKPNDFDPQFLSSFKKLAGQVHRGIAGADQK